jgi:hypothetical protein
MIYLYTGTPGSGKTLSAVKKIITSGKHVITNIVLDMSKTKRWNDVTYVETYDLTPKRLFQFYKQHKPKREGDLLFVFDEAQQVLGCRDWNADDRKAWISFFMEHRKLRYTVILISQWSKMLDKQVVPLIDYEWAFRRMSRFGLFGFIIFVLTLGEKYLVVEKYKPLDMVIGKHLSMVGRKYYRYYNSYQILTKYLDDDKVDEDSTAETIEVPNNSELASAPVVGVSAVASPTLEGGTDEQPPRCGSHFRAV